MKAEEAIRLMEEGKTLVNCKNGLKMYKVGKEYTIVSSNVDTFISFDLKLAEDNCIWGNDFAIKVSTAYLLVMPEMKVE